MEQRWRVTKRWILASCLVIFTTLTANAQTRPTLSEAESRIGILESDLSTLQADHTALQAEKDALQTEHDALVVEHDRTNTAICAKSDIDGDTYRPFVCPTRCDCLDAANLTADACTEVTSGEFEITGTLNPGTLCIGSCSDLSGPSQFDACLSQADCDAGESCVFTDIFGSGDPTAFCGIPQICSTNADCGPGYFCGIFFLCQVDIDCGAQGDPICPGFGTVKTLATLSGLGSDPDSPTPVQCEVLLPDPPGDGFYNAQDAMTCLQEIEASLGASCSYLCGDGGLDPGEQCDDGNTTPGDGCDASCQVEP